MLTEFYAVTLHSIYHVQALRPLSCSAIKIAGKKHSALSIGNDLAKGHLIAIGTRLQGYSPERQGEGARMARDCPLENTNTKNYKDVSTPIVALFMDKQSAEACSKESDKEPCDPRWLESTKRVVNQIGDDHPSFYVSRDPHFALLKRNAA